ncbi:hypothetical protein [Plantactinospora sp. KLBMP9567]|uniref:hypothetical protein n=1 Tax=Plantactinospora sp. KLBMP9567 TaxID=3085900 RepID=UPI002980EC16|nr:hypothetical protein [Plantactinospora sp. KLBMP9567]MDW5327961.1 hypothetical protein [Plantactinospora sp. KLBMP9567]
MDDDAAGAALTGGVAGTGRGPGRSIAGPALRLLALRVPDQLIAEITAFDSHLFAAFGLPASR